MPNRFGVDNLIVSRRMGLERTITFPSGYSHTGKVHRLRIHQDIGKLPIFKIDTTHADMNVSGLDVVIDLDADSVGDEGTVYGDILPGRGGGPNGEYFYALDFDYDSSTDDSDLRIQGTYDIVEGEGDADIDQAVSTLDLGDVTVTLTLASSGVPTFMENSDGTASQDLTHNFGTKRVGFHTRCLVANQSWQTVDSVDDFHPTVVATDNNTVTVSHTGYTPASGEYEYSVIDLS